MGRWFDGVLVFALVLAGVVVVLGAWTRLQDAGLGCPDWPGCYGFLSVPLDEHSQRLAVARFPDAPIEVHKAWPEMIHRYAAGTLGLLVASLCVMAWLMPGGPRVLVSSLAVLIIAQAAFGAWTVTLKLWPQVVTAHLLGGFATLTLLWLTFLRRAGWPFRARPDYPELRGHAWLLLAALVVQIALGGWTSSNYAALACPDFPTCHGQWWPPADFGHGFDVLQSVGPNYLGGMLEGDGRTAIHLAHRLGAVVVFLLGAGLAWRLARREPPAACVLGALLVIQVGLGIGNVMLGLPLLVAVLHNAVAALLLLSVVAIHYRLHPGRTFA